MNKFEKEVIDRTINKQMETTAPCNFKDEDIDPDCQFRADEEGERRSFSMFSPLDEAKNLLATLENYTERMHAYSEMCRTVEREAIKRRKTFLALASDCVDIINEYFPDSNSNEAPKEISNSQKKRLKIQKTTKH